MHRYSPAAENFIHPLRGKGREQGAGKDRKTWNTELNAPEGHNNYSRSHTCGLKNHPPHIPTAVRADNKSIQNDLYH
jgi:hypothetical protein